MHSTHTTAFLHGFTKLSAQKRFQLNLMRCVCVCLHSLKNGLIIDSKRHPHAKHTFHQHKRKKTKNKSTHWFLCVWRAKMPLHSRRLEFSTDSDSEHELKQQIRNAESLWSDFNAKITNEMSRKTLRCFIGCHSKLSTLTVTLLKVKRMVAFSASFSQVAVFQKTLSKRHCIDVRLIMHPTPFPPSYQLTLG